MLTVSKGGRSVAAMVLSSPVNNVRGIVQCLVPGCEAHAVLLHDDGDPAALIDKFLTTHACDPSRFPDRELRRERRRKNRGLA